MGTTLNWDIRLWYISLLPWKKTHTWNGRRFTVNDRIAIKKKNLKKFSYFEITGNK